MKEFFKDKKALIIIFIFLLLVFTLTPITGDDWGNYLVGQKGLSYIWNHTVSMYFTWEGRFISRLLISFMTYHKWLWNIINAFCLTSFIYICYKFINSREKTNYLIPIFLLLTVSNTFYTQVYLWVAGNITYLIPSILSLMVFYLLSKDSYSLIKRITLLFFSIIIPMFVENIGCAYVSMIFIYLIYEYARKKKISLQILFMFLLSAISLILMLKSPGSMIRMQANTTFSDMRLLEKILTNIPEFIKYAFSRNSVILLFMLILINKMLLSKLKNNRLKYLLALIFDIIPIITIITNIGSLFPLNIGSYLNINVGNMAIYFYWVIFALMWIFTVMHFIKEKKEKYFFLILLLGAYISLGVMLLTPVWGDRVSALYTLINILIIAKIWSDNLVLNKLAKKIFVILTIICIFITVSYTIINVTFSLRRKSSINNQINNEVIYIPVNKLETLWNFNPWDEYHLGTFKSYYKIEDKQTEYKEFTFNEYIDYLIKGE